MASISKDTFDFLKNLAKNNNREWFTENKSRYVAAQEEVTLFLTDMLERMAEFDEKMHKLDPKKTLFRIYRDTRFSKDKTPYKTNIGASINGIGKKDGLGGYYLHIEPGKSFLAAGVYMTDPKNLKIMRKEISENAEEFRSIVEDANFANFSFMDEKLSRVPQGFEKGDPMVEFLKMKHLVVSFDLKDADLIKANASESFAEKFRQMAPFVEFLNAPFQQ